DVDREGLRDARADPRDHTLVIARREGRERHSASSYGARDVHTPRADVRIEDENTRARLVDALIRVVTVRRLAENLDVPVLRLAVHLQGAARRNDHAELADVDARPDVRRPDRELHAAHVHAQVADAEPVVVMDVLEPGDVVRPVADPATEVDVHG